MSEEWWKIIVGGAIALVGLLLGGGRMGKIVASTLRTLVNAFIEQFSAQNDRLIKAVEDNTKRTSELTEAIHLDIEMQKQENNNRGRQLDRMEGNLAGINQGSGALMAATRELVQSNLNLLKKFEGRI